MQPKTKKVYRNVTYVKMHIVLIVTAYNMIKVITISQFYAFIIPVATHKFGSFVLIFIM